MTDDFDLERDQKMLQQADALGRLAREPESSADAVKQMATAFIAAWGPDSTDEDRRRWRAIEGFCLSPSVSPRVAASVYSLDCHQLRGLGWEAHGLLLAGKRPSTLATPR